MRKLILIAALLFAVSPAYARHHARHHHHRHHYVHVVRASNMAEGLGHGLIHMLNSARPTDCYGIAWCGCYMRHVMGVADRAYNLASNWAHWGSPTFPHVGAVVVWPHHVGVITGGGPGHWVVTSGNDGHAVRTRPRSLGGAIAFRI